MEKEIILLAAIMIIFSTLFSGCLNLYNTTDSSEVIDTDGDGIEDTRDEFPKNPNEWSDLDGDGVGDNSDAFPNDENEWIDTDGDKTGDNSDVFPNNSDEWSDTDDDGVGDNSDKNPFVNLSIRITLEKFKVTGKVDILRWAQVYFEINVNGKNVDTIDNNGRYWTVLLNQEKDVDYVFSYDIPDTTVDLYTNFTIVMKDYDFLKFDKDDIIDISNEANRKNLDLKFNNVENTISKNELTEGSQAKLWYNVNVPEDIDPSTKFLRRSYNWRFDNRNWKFSLDIPIKTYETYENSKVNRMPQGVSNEAMRSFVTYDELVVEEISQGLSSLVKNEEFSSVDFVNYILRFVQTNIVYSSDEETKGSDEYWRFPVESLVEKKGDCEDSSVLFSSIMKSLGYDAALLFYVLDDDLGHIAVGIHLDDFPGEYVSYGGKKYYYCETTTIGNDVGNIPPDISGSPEIIIKI